MLLPCLINRQIEGTSLESQRLACGSMHGSNNIKSSGFWGGKANREVSDRAQLIELLDFCRENKGKVQILLVWKVGSVRPQRQ